MYSNVQSIKISREGENRPPIGGVLIYKNMVEFVHVISYKLYGQFVRFTTWFWTVLIYIMIWTILIYIMFWNGFDLHHVLERFWFTSCFGTVLIYTIIYGPYIIDQVFLTMTSSEPVSPHTLIRDLFLIDYFVSCQLNHYY